MKVISYALFGEDNYSEKTKFVFDKYVLGVYFNARMNKLVYPDWQMVLFVEYRIYNKYLYSNYLIALSELTGMEIVIAKSTPKCEAMLWRMTPLFYAGATHLLCRDTDALTSYREAMAVNRWIESGKGFHVIHDNTAHGGLMGGLVGFDVKQFKDTFPEYDTFENLVNGFNLNEHGSDQNLMNVRLLPKIKNNLHTSTFPPSDQRAALWESDLCISFIGTAGVNEMETLRFFQRFDKSDKWDKFENEFHQICYWRR